MKENAKIFTLINAAALLEQEFEPLRFAVDKILPHGLFILAGSGKIGKSWLALDNLQRKANGKQKEYDDRVKAKKKAEMDAMKNAIRAEDVAKGVFVPVSTLPKSEPKIAGKTA